MSKASVILSPFHNLPAGDLADRLGALKAEIADLEAREKALRDELIRRGSSEIEGALLADAVQDLIREGDVYGVRNRLFLVAPVNRDQLETLIAPAGSVEDLEENGDREPSIGPYDDLESDGNCDAEDNGDAERDHDDDGVYGDGGTERIAAA